MSNEIFSLQGQFYTAIRNTSTGKPGALTNIGNVSKCDIALAPTISDKYESFTGARVLYGRLMKERKGDLTMTVDEFKTENLLLGLMGLSPDIITGTTVTAEVCPTVTEGQAVRLANSFATLVSVVDSAVGPLTLTAGTDYVVTGSTVTFIGIPGTQPYKVSYTYGTGESVAMMTSLTPVERYVFFDGLDTNTGAKVSVDIFRVQFVPAKTFSLIDPDWGSLELTGAILYDAVNAANANFGGFARITTNFPAN
jgi:hypothetical protein